MVNVNVVKFLRKQRKEWNDHFDRANKVKFKKIVINIIPIKTKPVRVKKRWVENLKLISNESLKEKQN